MTPEGAKGPGVFLCLHASVHDDAKVVRCVRVTVYLPFWLENWPQQFHVRGVTSFHGLIV